MGIYVVAVSDTVSMLEIASGLKEKRVFPIKHLLCLLS